MSRGKIITVYGTTPNIGTSLIAFALAMRLCERQPSRVFYLCLNLKSAKIHRYIGIDYPEYSLEQLRPLLQMDKLDAASLQQATIRPKCMPQLSILAGNRLRDQAEFYTLSQIEHLLAVVVEQADIVVLDAGAYWDNAATIVALQRADDTILVTTPALTHFQEDGNRWLKQLAPMFNVDSHGHHLIVSQQVGQIAAYSEQNILQELGGHSVYKVKLTPTMLAQLDYGTYDQWLSHHHEGKQFMQQYATQFYERHLPCYTKEVVRKQAWYKRWRKLRFEGR